MSADWFQLDLRKLKHRVRDSGHDELTADSLTHPGDWYTL
jgi:hypothetical protein